MRLKGPAAGLLILAAAPAAGHEFTAGADVYAGFVEGVAVPLSWPPALVCLIAFGILAGLWRNVGPGRPLAALVLGGACGIGLSGLQLPASALAPHVVGLCVAALAASGLSPSKPLDAAAGFLTGAAAIAGTLDGHPLGAIPLSVYVGICFGAGVLAVATTALAMMSFDRWGEAKWLSITWRTVASWCAAILLLALAFEFRPIPV
ncbi:hypothetical protein [Vannielia litorea]|uniref:hypothetical protein n=1 Tax=Vannielia litorea TaxID=1217970 RepID=UPI001BCC7BDB|nr:hypothetical protein [Vannielia litorea]MBS8225570.1 hypothetical protein [Vannielia litorea]